MNADHPREGRCAPVSADATPRVEPGETAFRAGLGRCTVDIISTDGSDFLVIVGHGVGTAPETIVAGVEAVAALLVLANTIDTRTVWNTQAWPLAC